VVTEDHCGAIPVSRWLKTGQLPANAGLENASRLATFWRRAAPRLQTRQPDPQHAGLPDDEYCRFDAITNMSKDRHALAEGHSYWLILRL
jgi:hypothetical protein